MKKYSCATINLTKFKDEIVPKAIEKVLSNKKITKVIFAQAAQESTAVGVARAIARKRSLEIAFA